MTKKRITRAAALFIFIAICTGMVWAQDSYWEGKVSTAPYGLLPNSGMYAASNAFSLDSKVEITHPSNGTTIEVRVVERVDTDRIFMQVSREAAQELGISEDEILTAKVSPVQTNGDMIESMVSQDKPYTSDPDLNPSAEMDEDGLTVVERYLADRSKAEQKQKKPEKTPGTPPALETAPDVEPAEETKPEEAEEPEEPEEPVEASVPEADSLPDTSQPRSQITVELPEPSLQPERKAEGAPDTEEELAAEEAPKEGDEPAGPEVAELEPLFIQEKDRRYSPAAPQLPDEDEPREGPIPSLASVIPAGGEGEEADLRISHAPEPQKEDLPSADIAAAEEPEGEAAKDEKLSHAPVLPAEEVPEEDEKEAEEIPEDAELALIPAEERPPEGPPTVTEEEPEEKTPAEEERPQVSAEGDERVRPSAGELSVQRSIDSESYYLQVAAYSKLDLARTRGRELAAQYPVTLYQEDGSGKAPYKLMIGPLNEHESGTLLFTFTARGYRDAFIRKGN